MVIGSRYSVFSIEYFVESLNTEY